MRVVAWVVLLLCVLAGSVDAKPVERGKAQATAQKAGAKTGSQKKAVVAGKPGARQPGSTRTKPTPRKRGVAASAPAAAAAAAAAVAVVASPADASQLVPAAASVPAAVAAPVSTLRVSTVERPPFTFFHEDGKVTGFSADLWREIARRNNWSFEWKREDKFPAMIAAVKERASDVAIANISITSEREQILDFSQPIYDSGLQIVVPSEERGIGLFRLIWESGALKLIGIAVLVLLGIAHLMWFFERNVKTRRHDYFRDDYRGGVWDAFWWAFIVMTMGGFEGEVPHRYWSRALAMIWIVISLFFVSTLTAKLTTSLTVDQLTSDIKSYHDLLGKKVGVGENTAMSKFLDLQNIPYKAYRDYKEALTAVEVGKLDATIADAPVAQYYVAHAGNGRVELAGSVFKPDKFGVALPQGSPLREAVDHALLAIREDGTYEALSRKWFGAQE